MTEAYFSLLVFIILMVATPGPANLVAMIGGTRRGLPGCAGFILGLVAGKLALNIAFGIGLGVLLTSRPVMLDLVKYAGAAYMAWLALQSWNPPEQGAEPDREFRFHHGLIVHPLNPKAWVMLLLAWTQFAPALGGFWLQIVLVPVSFAVCQLVFHSLWCWAGGIMGRALPQSRLMTRGLVILTLAVVVWALMQ